jgi:hypothetical protein
LAPARRGIGYTYRDVSVAALTESKLAGLLQVGGLAEARQVDLSGHGAPAISAHAFRGVPRLRHLEYFHTHVRVEGVVGRQVAGPGALPRARPPPGPELIPDDRPGKGHRKLAVRIRRRLREGFPLWNTVSLAGAASGFRRWHSAR